MLQSEKVLSNSSEGAVLLSTAVSNQGTASKKHNTLTPLKTTSQKSPIAAQNLSQTPPNNLLVTSICQKPLLKTNSLKRLSSISSFPLTSHKSKQNNFSKTAPAVICSLDYPDNILCVNNLESLLLKFSLILDSMLLLRLLLHKLSWDLSLVAKKRQQVKNLKKKLL